MSAQRVTIEGSYDPATGQVTTAIPVSGTVTTTPGGTQTVNGTVTANQGTAAAIAQAWPAKLIDGTGTNTAAVLSSGAAATSSLAVVTGTPVAGTPAAITANGNTATVDFGAARSNWSAICVATGSPTAGTLTLELSHNDTAWVSSTVTASVTAAGTFLLASTGRAARYARVNLSGLTGTISLTCSFMAAG